MTIDTTGFLFEKLYFDDGELVIPTNNESQRFEIIPDDDSKEIEYSCKGCDFEVPPRNNCPVFIHNHSCADGGGHIYKKITIQQSSPINITPKQFKVLVNNEWVVVPEQNIKPYQKTVNYVRVARVSNKDSFKYETVFVSEEEYDACGNDPAVEPENFVSWVTEWTKDEF